MKIFNRISLIAILIGAFIMSGCDKTKPYDVTYPPPLAHFDGADLQSYAVRASVVDPYFIEVGTTDVANVDRTVSFTVTSSTGAVAGTQYTLSGTNNTVVIPAGKATANIIVQGIFAGYPVGRVDTLIFTLKEPTVKVAGFSGTVKLAIGDICVEGAGFVLSTFSGDYANTNEDFGGPYGPYTTSISSVTTTGPTTGVIVVENIWDNGWGPITFDLDWTDPTNLTASVRAQAAIPGSDAGNINPAYAGLTIAVRAHPTGGPGEFSTCNNNLTLRMQLGVTGLGYFSPIYKVVMER